MYETDKKPLEADRETLIERMANLIIEMEKCGFYLAACKVREAQQILVKTRKPK